MPVPVEREADILFDRPLMLKPSQEGAEGMEEDEDWGL